MNERHAVNRIETVINSGVNSAIDVDVERSSAEAVLHRIGFRVPRALEASRGAVEETRQSAS